MKNSVKVAVITGLLAVTGIGSVTMIAKNSSAEAALGDRPNQSVRVAQTADSEANEGSGEVDEANEADDNEVEENAQYASLSKITASQAQQTAEAAQGDSATEVALDVADGSLVYEVEFANAEVIVDAGSGEILKTELANQEEEDATEAPIRGSVQVPDNEL